jgi:hypothetical protein
VPPLPITDVAGFGLHPFGNFGIAQWDQNPVGYQYPALDTDPNMLIVYDESMQPVAFLDEAKNAPIEEELNGIETLEFILPIDSPNWPEIKGERYVMFAGREFVILTAVTFGYIGYRKGLEKDSYSAGNTRGNLESDIAYIKRRTDDVLLEQKDTNKSINLLAERVTRVEESAKSAHKRIDLIEEKGL